MPVAMIAATRIPNAVAALASSTMQIVFSTGYTWIFRSSATVRRATYSAPARVG